MILKDLIILGRACPEPLKDGRITVCLAGWSEQHGFIRLYPTRPNMAFKRWDIVQVDVEENERDTRAESWKIAGSKLEWEKLADKAKVTGRVNSGDARRNIIGNLADPCVKIINNQKRSLGIIRPQVLKTYFKVNPKYGQLFQQGLPGFTELGTVKVKRDFEKEPRVNYRCIGGDDICTEHDQQVLEWGFYEWFRKNPDNIEQVWENAGFTKQGTDIYFLVGNQFAHRTSFMIISVLRVPAGEINKPLFPYKKWQGDDAV